MENQIDNPKAKDTTYLVRLVNNTLPSIHSKLVYSRAIGGFMAYWHEEGYPPLTKGFLNQYIMELQDDEAKGEATVNLYLVAIRKLANEAVDNEIWPEKVATAFARVKSIPVRGQKTHNWLTDVLAPHDLRRTFAKLAHTSGAPVEQIQLSLGHASLSTTELYLGLDQDFQNAPSDYINIDLK